MRVAIVTGAGRGIGRAIAAQLAAGGARVVIAEFADYGEQAAIEIRQDGNEAVALRVDVADIESVRNMVRTVLDRYGRIDILVNNAGIRPTCPFQEMSAEDWENVLRINLTGAFNCCSAAAPSMIEKRWGRIINISSLAAQQGSTGGHSHYAAAKAGLIGLSRSLAREFAPYTITVNTIAPGWIETEGWGGQLDGRREEYARKVPLGRLGRPEDVAYLVEFLAGECASYITGALIPVNGGLYIS